MNIKAYLFPLVVILLHIAWGSTASAALILNYEAANYSIVDNGNGTSTATWVNTGTAGSAYNSTNTLSNTLLAAFPTINAGATPNGSIAIGFGISPFGGRYAAMDATYTVPTEFSMFAVVQSPGSGSAQVLLGAGSGTGGATFRLDGGSNLLTLTKRNIADVGTSTSGFNTSDFHIIGYTYSTTTGAYNFYVDGVNVGSGTNALTFNQPWQLIGTGVGNTLPFLGQMAALQVYDTVLDSTGVANVTTSLTNVYLIPEPSTYTLIGLGLAGLWVLRRRARQQS